MERKFPELLLSARKAMKYCAVRAEEKVVVFADSGQSPAVVDAFYTAAVETGAETVLVSMPTAARMLTDPPAAAVEAMIAADVVFDLATMSWLYTESNGRVVRSGTRMLQVLVDEDAIISRPPDPRVIERVRFATDELFLKCESVRVTSTIGTDFVAQRGGRGTLSHTGAVVKPGDWSSFGLGMVNFAPIEDKADGVIVVNGTMALHPQHHLRVEQPVRVLVAQGRITSVDTDHRDGQILEEWLRSWDDPNSYVIAHMGLGFDHRASIHSTDFPAWQCRHAGVTIAFGTNVGPQLGGRNKAASHMDLTLTGASFYFDDRLVLENGKFVLEELQ